MSKTLITLAIATLATPIFAQEETFTAGQLRGVIEADWNEDGIPDRAILSANEDATLNLHLFVSGADGALEAPIVAREIGWEGAVAGQRPVLKLNRTGGLDLITGNDAIGRDRWEQTLSIGYTEGVFNLNRVTFERRDTLDLDFEYFCSITLDSSNGLFNGTSFESSYSTMPITQWNWDQHADCPDV